MSKSKHMAIRMQQRGISELQRLMLVHFGEYYLQKGGTELVMMSHESAMKIRKALEDIEKMAMIIGEDSSEITVMHKTKSIRHTGLVA